MAKGPYVRPRMRGNFKVFDIRPTEELKKAFPKIKRETYTSSGEANARGFELKRAFEAWKCGNYYDAKVDSRSVEALVDYYKSSMFYINIKTQASKTSYSDHIRHVLIQHVGKTVFCKMHVSDVDYDYANALWLHIQDTVSTHKANHTFKVLRLVWNEGIRGDRAKSNPFALVKLPALPARKVMWDLEQLRGMINYCDEQGYPSMGTMLTVCFEFCQRPVDVRKMKWAHIDGRTGVSNFIQQKTGKQMSIRVTNAVQKRLHLHTKRNSDDYIFAYENTGKPFTQDRCQKIFRKLAEGYGLPKVALEDQFNKDGSQKYSTIWMADLRRTGATHASQSGCTDREMMSLTGHRNPSMLVVYAIEGEIESTNANTKRGLL